MEKGAILPQGKKERLVLLDLLRGVGIIFVIWYHLMFDLWDFYGICRFIVSDQMDVVRDIMVGMLVLISGVCCHFSRSNMKRGAVCFLIAMGLTVVTGFMGEYSCIRFGILHMFGSSMLLYGVFTRLVAVKHRRIWAAVCFAAFLFTFMISSRSLGIYRLQLLQLPDALYRFPFWFWLGFPNLSFISADYYPLLPWTFLFFCGGFLGADAHRLPKIKACKGLKPLVWIGSHTMFLYLLHQPIFYAILFLIR